MSRDKCLGDKYLHPSLEMHVQKETEENIGVLKVPHASSYKDNFPNTMPIQCEWGQSSSYARADM